MKRSPRQQLTYVGSILFGAAPVVFGLIRFIGTGSDLRFLWMALASFLGATVVMAIGDVRSRRPGGVVALSAAGLVLATLLGAVTAFLLGARAALSVWFVAFGFGLCFALSFALGALSNPHTK